jgi:hypothetical protein
MRSDKPTSVSTTYLEGSAHPVAFRVVRRNPPRVLTERKLVGTNDVQITVGKDKPPATTPLALPGEWAVAEGLVQEHVPLSFEPLQHLPSAAKTYTIRRPMLSLDVEAGILKGTATLSIPDGNYPERIVSPLEVPVEITIKLPTSLEDAKQLQAHVRACAGVCADVTVEVRYDHERLVKLVQEMNRAAAKMQQSGSRVDQLAQVVFDVEDLIRDAVSQVSQSVYLQAMARAPLSWGDATVGAADKSVDYNWLGWNLIPKGPLFDFAVPGWGYRGNRIHGRSVPHTAALLAYPSLPAVFAGEHWTNKFPAFVYGEVSYAKKVSRSLELGVRLTMALDIWERLGLRPDAKPPQLFGPNPAGTNGRPDADYLSERGQALEAIKKNLRPANDLQPWVMLRLEGRFDWP